MRLKPHYYHCDNCGKEDFWAEGWGWYGSYAQEETCYDDLPTGCSPECMDAIELKIKSGEWKLPDVKARPGGFKKISEREGY